MVDIQAKANPVKEMDFDKSELQVPWKDKPCHSLYNTIADAAAWFLAIVARCKRWREKNHHIYNLKFCRGNLM